MKEGWTDCSLGLELAMVEACWDDWCHRLEQNYRVILHPNDRVILFVDGNRGSYTCYPSASLYACIYAASNGRFFSFKLDHYEGYFGETE